MAMGTLYPPTGPLHLLRPRRFHHLPQRRLGAAGAVEGGVGLGAEAPGQVPEELKVGTGNRKVYRENKKNVFFLNPGSK